MKRWNQGFTLAEVLITLGIIGVVAGMTIPNLMTQIQDRQFKEAAKEAYSKTSQVIQQMMQDQGGSLAYYNNTVNSFKPVFMPYFKVVKDCNSSDCVPDSTASTIYTSLAGDRANTTSLGADGQFVTADGMFYNIQNNPSSYTDIIIVVDVNGYEKGPNVYGRDTFAFSLLNDKLSPLGSQGTFSGINWLCNRNTSNYMQGITCMTNVMKGTDY